MATGLDKVLMAYRTTPQSTTGIAPSQLLQGQKIRTWLDLLRPSVSERVEHRQLLQKFSHDSLDQRRTTKTFSKGETVYTQNFGAGQKWLSAIIQEVLGPFSFLVKLEDGRLVRHHLYHCDTNYP